MVKLYSNFDRARTLNACALTFSDNILKLLRKPKD